MHVLYTNLYTLIISTVCRDASTHMISFTTLMRLQQHTSLIMLKCLFKNIEQFVSSHYTIPPTSFLSVMRAQTSTVYIFSK